MPNLWDISVFTGSDGMGELLDTTAIEENIRSYLRTTVQGYNTLLVQQNQA